MKKKFLLNTILWFLVMTVYSQNFKLQETIFSEGTFRNIYKDKIIKITFLSEANLEIIYVAGETIKIISNKLFHSEIIEGKLTFNYKIKHDNGITYIELDEELPLYLFENKKLPSEDRKRIYFIGFLSENAKYPNIFGGIKSQILFGDELTGTKDPGYVTEYTKSSSYLIEKDINYDESHLTFSNIKWNYCASNWIVPWVENVSGYGIGEYVEIKYSGERQLDYLLIANGYFSIDKPYLYKQNSRVKQIKVTGLKSGNEKILDVLDTPHPQTVDISFLETQEPFRVTIMDVYKGTKYEDTCINCMEPYPYAVIPYEDSIGE